MEAELDQVVQALQTLYSPATAPSVQSTLQSQLLSVQSSPLGWSLISPFLSHPDPSIRFFGASTLEAKLSKQYDSLSRRERLQLEESLLGWLTASARNAYPAAAARVDLGQASGVGASGEKPVLRKLSVAVVTYALKRFGTGSNKSHGRRQRGTDDEDDEEEPWQDWLLQVVVRIAASGSTREAGLEVLSTVIEQVQRAELTGTKRMGFMDSLRSSTPHLVQTLTTSLAPSSSPSESTLALSCFNSYLSAGQLSHVELSTLYPLLISHLSNPLTIVAACSAIEELVERSNGYNSSGGGSGVTKFMNRSRCTELIERWVTSQYVTELTRATVAEASEEIEDDAMAVFKLVSTLAEYFISTYLFDPPPPTPAGTAPLTLLSPSIHSLLSMLITLTTFPGHSQESSYAINELANGSWMALQEYGADLGFTLNGQIDPERSQEEWQVYKGVWEALERGLTNRAVRPRIDEFEAWPKDVRDGFRIYRNTVLIDPIQYCYYVLREEMLARLVELANAQINAPPTTQGRDGYEELEATLFVLNCLAECVPISPPPSLSASTSSTASTSTSLTSTYLSYLFSPSLLGRIATTPIHHASLRTTALKLIESYSAWFSSSTTPDQSCLLSAIQFVVHSLSEPSLIPQAVRSLRALCDSNRRELTGHVGEFVGILGGLEQQGQGRVDESELAKVLESVASVVQALDKGQIVEPILTLSGPVISKLEESTLRGREDQNVREEAKETSLTQLRYLTSLTKGLSTPEPEVLDIDTSFDDTGIKEDAYSVLGDARIQATRARLGSAIEQVVTVWANDLEVVSAVSDLIRCSISESIPGPLSLDPLPLLSLASSSLQRSPSSIWLGIGGNLLARLARDQHDRRLEPERLPTVARPVEGMLTVVLSTHGDLSAMTENPDVVSSFLSFCAQIVRHYPSIFYALPAHYLDAVLAFAERGLGMQEQFSLKSTIELLLLSVQQTKMASDTSSVFFTTLSPRVPSLIRSTLVAVAGAVPRSHLISLSELLHACLLRLPDQSRSALKQVLATPGWPNERTTEEAKGKFERSVLSARTGRQIRQAVNDFALLARGLEGSAYGAQTGM